MISAPMVYCYILEAEIVMGVLHRKGGTTGGRQIGTICQSGVFMGKRCICWVQKGSFSAISHYVFNEVAQTQYFIVRNCRKWSILGPKNAQMCCRTANLTNGARSVSRRLVHRLCSHCQNFSSRTFLKLRLSYKRKKRKRPSHFAR